MASEYIFWPGEKYPGETYAFSTDKVDADTTLVHSELGWEWERVTESEIPDYASIVPDLLGATQAGAQSIDVPLDKVVPAGSTAAVSTAVVGEIWSKVVTAEKGVFLQVTADMIEANAITADKISVGALDGQVITGALIRTSHDGARIQMDANSFAAYNQNGDQTIRINGHNGNIFINGDLGIEDIWSRTSFTDVVGNNGPDDQYYGTGILYEVKTGGIKPGGIALFNDTQKNKVGLSMSAPGPNRLRPKIDLSNQDLDIVLQDSSNTRLYLNENLLLAASLEFSFSVSKTGFNYSSKRNGSGNLTPMVYARSNGEWQIGPQEGSGYGRSWGSARAAVLDYGGNQVFVNNSGVHQTGNKAFVMPVPGIREGEWLRHCSTESPWDGIEYWGIVTLDANGTGRYTAPYYVPAILRGEIPAVCFTNGQSSPARGSVVVDDDAVHVDVTGAPGDSVHVLLKAARRVFVGRDGDVKDGTSTPVNPDEGWVEQSEAASMAS